MTDRIPTGPTATAPMTRTRAAIPASFGNAVLERRGFLRSAAATVALVAVPAWLTSACAGSPIASSVGADGAAASAGGGATTAIKATHGTGLCNLSVFIAKERGLAEEGGVELDFVVTPTNADIATLFGAGQVEASLIPYSNFMTLYDAGAPVTIVAGGGVEGCVIVAQKGITGPADLRGKTLGTFQADTLEVLPYDYLAAGGVSWDEVDVKYFGTSPEMAQAFISGAVDSICHIEPYATQALAGAAGSTALSNGKDIYGEGYTDCVLAVQNQLLAERPDDVKALIKALMLAQSQIEEDLDSAVADTVGTYYKASAEEVADAASKQPSVVDQRGRTQFVLDRGQVMKDLGYVKTLPDEAAFDYTLLEEVIDENADLYSSLKLTYA